MKAIFDIDIFVFENKVTYQLLIDTLDIFEHSAESVKVVSIKGFTFSPSFVHTVFAVYF